jgi:cell division protease FtsH
MIYGELTTGAESDLVELTRIARYMVGRWGMSPEIGMITVLDGDMRGNAAPQTLGQIDAEVRRIADEAYADVAALLREERDRLDALVEALLVHETLDAEDAYRVVGLERPMPLPTDGRPPLKVREGTLLEDQ